MPRRPRWTFVLLLYPFILYALLTSGHGIGVWLGLFSLGTLVLLPGLRTGNPLAWALLAGTGAIAYFAVSGGHQALVFFLPQIMISLFLLVVFSRTLKPGRVPLITRIAMAIHHDGSEVPLEYTRRVTILWVVIFVMLITEGLVLALLVPDVPLKQVSLATYVLVALVMFAEYCYHNWRYPSPAHRGIVDFLRHVMQIDYRRLLSD